MASRGRACSARVSEQRQIEFTGQRFGRARRLKDDLVRHLRTQTAEVAHKGATERVLRGHIQQEALGAGGRHGSSVGVDREAEVEDRASEEESAARDSSPVSRASRSRRRGFRRPRE